MQRVARSPFKQLHVINCWEKHNGWNSRVARVGVTSLKSVEPCPSRSVRIWLNSCMKLCAKNQLPKSEGLQELSSSDENQVDLHRTDPEAQQSQHTLVLAGAMHKHRIPASCQPHRRPRAQPIAQPYKGSVHSADKNYARGLLLQWQWLGVSHGCQAWWRTEAFKM